MPHQSKVTTDQETIRAWAEERGGKPSRVKDASRASDDLLRIRFEDDDDLEDISWDEFFDNFEEHRLAFLYQEETKDGEESRFCKIIYRDDDEGGGKRKKGSKKKEREDNDEEDEEEDELGEDDIEEDEGYDADDEEEDEM